MTQVTLHGTLAKEFQKSFNLSINRPKEVFDAISCSHPKFRHRIVELARQGIYFTILVNGKKIEKIEDLKIRTQQSIDIVPLICGSGPAVIVPFLIAAAKAILMTAAMTALTMLLTPKPEIQRPTSNVSASKQSFTFSSKANVIEQGMPIPIGYGRLRVGSAIIQSSVKSYPQAFQEKDLFKSGTESSQSRINTNTQL
jgi:predicted phage tail protein